MKPYFTKYLPVEGEIKEGDIVLSESCNHPPAKIQKIMEDGSLLTDENDLNDPLGNCYYILPKETRRVELFLCSRDIQVGDKYYSLAFHEYHIAKDEHSSCFVRPHEYTKVIGKVSPEAIWVKEGMEFDEEDIKKIRRERLINVPDDWTDAEYEEYTLHYKIKCPTCRTFH